ncbi:hypothetical protein [Mucilaginibacter aquaedulcis]|jgi:hypothetical protein|uniref:hypothetical protein n=1 Tax=Mucilaginibacter aquaedulcis TaxID=1187081 RepID=UPI0025B49F3D|nr:hypothetical protein [Mucilaginibacter aquaedulcis]MDN3547026.1 hypothetical protein [Mucilaginibacter aquaedulcis]
MSLKNLILLLAAIFYLNTGFGQETTVVKHKLTDGVTEKISVLKSDKGIRQGLYQAVSDEGRAVASGNFEHDKKVGVWHFYDMRGRLVQNYDYTKKQLLYEALEDTTSNLRYFVDKILTDTDRTTKPVKPGGRYFGYIPYLKLFKLPQSLMGIDRLQSVAVIELLVSPYGRLADYKVHLYSGPTYEKVFNMNLNALNEEDKIFIPATINNEPVGCRIMIRCSIDNYGGIGFF